MDIKQIHPLKFSLAVLVAAMVLLNVLVVSAYAAEKNDVVGKVYEFDKGFYEFSKSEKSANTDTNNTYGEFFVEGNYTRGSDKSGIPSFSVKEGSLDLFYEYDDRKLNADEDSWHLVDDKGKKVDTLSLDPNIMKGVLILQLSTDGKNWNTIRCVNNAFQVTPKSSKKAIYTCSAMQLENGCYYRFIVAYTLSKREKEGKILIFKNDKYEIKRYAEVYEFYAHADNAGFTPVSSGQRYLGDKVRVKDFGSFSGKESIGPDDIHYGWELGRFYVKGYTQVIDDNGKAPVFLKNAGDKVILGFKLEENIEALHDDEKMKVSSIEMARDQEFETEPTKFGRGALIVQYTDYTKEKINPQIYCDFLSANAKQEAETIIQLCEEGDYKVALDYEIKKDNRVLLDKTGRYRISCEFSVRNSNCMVFPKDAATGNELVNGSITERGFWLDLAKSRYLDLYVKREVLNPAGNDFDTRFNRAAKDGEKFKDDGIYTITVRNKYTKEEMVTKIAVGSNPILRAWMMNKKTIPEIKALVEQGAEIQNDGFIKLPAKTQDAPSSETIPLAEDATSSVLPKPSVKPEQTATEAESIGSPVAVVVGVLVFLVALVGILVMKRKKKDKTSS